MNFMNIPRPALQTATTLAIGVLFCAAPPAANGQDRCQPFRATIAASLVPVDGTSGFVWKGEITFTIGNGLPTTGTTETILTAVKKGGPDDPTAPVYMGTEETTVRVAAKPGVPASSVVLLTRFVTPQKSFYTNGVGEITETGTIAPAADAGVFRNAYGHFVLRGSYGPAVAHLPGSMLGWVGEYHGNMCAVE
jgi:hypothetical protein